MARANAVCGGVGLLLVLMVITARQMHGHRRVEQSDGGAPLEVLERVKTSPAAVEKNATTLSLASSSSDSRSKNETVVAPWDEMSSANRTGLKKAKKMFESATAKKDYMPGEQVIPEGGLRMTAAKHLVKLGHAKCVALVGFYNSEDKEKSEAMAGAWNEFFYAEMGKFEFGLCDVRKTSAKEVAIEAGLSPNGTHRKIELPAVVAFPARDFTNESVVVLKSGGKSSKYVKSVFNVVDNLQLTLSKDGCYSKLKTPLGDSRKLAKAADSPPSSSSSEAKKRQSPYSIGALPSDTASEMTSLATSA